MTEDNAEQDDLTWLLNELILTAERARDRGLSPEEFLIGLRTYAKEFEKDYTQTLEE